MRLPANARSVPCGSTVNGELRCFALTEPETGSDIMVLRTATVPTALTEAASATLCKVVAGLRRPGHAGPTGEVRMFLMRRRHVAEMTAR
jgi:alkylation response protein AidB-like acyl-CoA dehydrogenase